jgi:COP9 signalosome complex subunit 3
LIKKLTSTYLTLGLAEIGKNVRIADVEEVRALILKMVGAPKFLEHID